jgi:hypothetical protein
MGYKIKNSLNNSGEGMGWIFVVQYVVVNVAMTPWVSQNGYFRWLSEICWGLMRHRSPNNLEMHLMDTL